jgi:hypothetical protein
MARINKILHLKRNSTTSAAPGAGDLDYGEIAINYHADVSRLYFKDSDDTIKVINDSTKSPTSAAVSEEATALAIALG